MQKGLPIRRLSPTTWIRSGSYVASFFSDADRSMAPEGLLGLEVSVPTQPTHPTIHTDRLLSRYEGSVSTDALRFGRQRGTEGWRSLPGGHWKHGLRGEAGDKLWGGAWLPNGDPWLGMMCRVRQDLAPDQSTSVFMFIFPLTVGPKLCWPRNWTPVYSLPN